MVKAKPVTYIPTMNTTRRTFLGTATATASAITAATHLKAQDNDKKKLKLGIIGVGGRLDLRTTPIRSLPKGLQVGGDLDLAATGVTKVPEGTRVGGDLFLNGSHIDSLPKSLRLGGGLPAGPDGLAVFRNGVDAAAAAATAPSEQISLAMEAPCPSRSAWKSTTPSIILSRPSSFSINPAFIWSICRVAFTLGSLACASILKWAW